jgi:hypothetical protein
LANQVWRCWRMARKRRTVGTRLPWRRRRRRRAIRNRRVAVRWRLRLWRVRCRTAVGQRWRTTPTFAASRVDWRRRRFFATSTSTTTTAARDGRSLAPTD